MAGAEQAADEREEERRRFRAWQLVPGAYLPVVSTDHVVAVLDRIFPAS